ncbi:MULTISPECIES: tripartite tricarboxylate transporter substrate binding protein [unclassified Achromobacter]|uniref:Bug family tripartite tricarboxylate transporter substrate binding protein n=1 Tax=unclassified Achromobacter TaxID=2626865 RepID=UPI000B516379|nr:MULTISPECIES: tripartite tricarboxylate transporter substrate binding protein [unclassified Achromobacter]OWT72752.1 ABC transporter substrate-binding protein [Achromobacter sp. HZ34]OWT73971.1 ABC transporter substrate-binding protein [Achromobacter sp. HZ28]
MKPSHRRALLSVLACVPALSLCSAPALAGAYPDRPVTLIVPFGAGGITDIVARATGKALGEQLGQSIIVENRPGAGGNIAADFIRRAKPDGYTLMFTTMGVLAVNPHTDMKASFDSKKDFSFISLVGNTPHLIAVNAGVAATSLGDLIKLAKAKPGSISFGTAGVGSSPYQGMQILQEAAGIQFLHVPYKSGAESVTGVVAGQVDMTFEATPQVMPFVASQKLRALAVANTQRLASAPDVPSTTELGFPGIVSGSVSGLIGPAGLPAEVVSTLNAAVAKVVADPAFKDALLKQGTATASSSPEEFRRLVAEEDTRWAKIMAKAKEK